MGMDAVCLHTEITFVTNGQAVAGENPRVAAFTYLPSEGFCRFSLFCYPNQRQSREHIHSSHSAGITMTASVCVANTKCTATVTSVKRIRRRETNPDVLLYAMTRSIHRRMIPHRQLKLELGCTEFYEPAFEDCRLVYNRLPSPRKM